MTRLAAPTRAPRGVGLLLLTAVGLAGCEPDLASRLPPFDAGPIDAARRDASTDSGTPVDASNDAGDAGDASDVGTDLGRPDVGFDAGRLDAGMLGTCTAGLDRQLATTLLLDDFDPALGSIGSDLVVSHLVSNSGVVDLAAVRVPPNGTIPASIPITNDALVESEPVLTSSLGSYVLAFVRTTALGFDIATVSLDAVAGTLGGINDITLDAATDRAPRFGTSATAAVLFFDRVGSPTEYQRVEVSNNGSAIDGFAPVSSASDPMGPYAVDGRASDRRLFRVPSVTTLESFALDATGRQVGSTVQSTTLTAGSFGSRIRVSPDEAATRAVLVAGTSSGRNAAFLSFVNASGAFVGSPIDVDPVRTVESPALAVTSQGVLVAYRTFDGSPQLRARVFSPTGQLLTDAAVLTLDLTVGRVEARTTADGSRTYLVYDDLGSPGLELRAVQVACTP